MAWKSLSMCSVEGVIRRGGFGEVLLVRKHLDKQLYAVKTLRPIHKTQTEDQQTHEKMQTDQVLLLMAINHPNIVRVFGKFTEEDKRYLVMEYCETDMDCEIKRVREEGRLLADPDIYYWTRQLASAVSYLHKTNIRHDDIKPKNILLKCEEINNKIWKTVRLADFEFYSENKDSENLKDSDGASGIVGTVAYLSPDVIAGGESCVKRDVWAFGATIYAMTTLETLAQGEGYDEIVRDISSFQSLKNDRSKEITKLKPDLVDFLNFILNPDRDERPSMDLVMEHRFLDDLPRLFISYSWKNKETVLAVKDRLLQWKFDVWIDDQNMYGNITDGMAEAIEQATVTLLCFSSDYAQSRNCKAEADYVFRLGKPFIPLKMQRDYSPHGWLGIIIGNALYYDFSKEERFDQSFEKLVDALRHLGRFPNSDHPTTLQKRRDAAVQTTMKIGELDADDNNQSNSPISSGIAIDTESPKEGTPVTSPKPALQSTSSRNPTTAANRQQQPNQQQVKHIIPRRAPPELLVRERTALQKPTQPELPPLMISKSQTRPPEEKQMMYIGSSARTLKTATKPA